MPVLANEGGGALAGSQQQLALLLTGGRTGFTLRMHRALSWLRRAEQAGGDDDVAFICLWIAFNAAYARELPGFSEREQYKEFMRRVCDLDQQRALYGLVWQAFAGPVRGLLNNQYVFQPFWDWHNLRDQPDAAQAQDWQKAFETAKKRANRALAEQDTAQVLQDVFARLYTLRNQLMHGGATWGSSVNRAQVREGRLFLERVLPAMLDVMLQNPGHFAEPPFYPVVNPA